MTPSADRDEMPDGPARDPRRRGQGGRSKLFLTSAVIVAALFFVLFVALGTWQVKRRLWKLDLIARVERRVHAPPEAAPGPAQWPGVTAANYEYRHITVTGTFLGKSDTLVQAVTDLGAGYWVLTPLRSSEGSIFLVNRGFVPSDDRDRVRPGAMGAAMTGNGVKVIGLLRMSEPGGGFLRRNDPAADRWYSRDVHAIAAARGLTQVAPYFIDAEAATDGPPGVVPVAGLTVITFHNSHLVYAITWYTLALMVAGAIGFGIRSETRT